MEQGQTERDGTEDSRPSEESCTTAAVNACSFQRWYPRFKEHTFPSIVREWWKKLELKTVWKGKKMKWAWNITNFFKKNRNKLLRKKELRGFDLPPPPLWADITASRRCQDLFARRWPVSTPRYWACVKSEARNRWNRWGWYFPGCRRRRWRSVCFRTTWLHE